MSRDTGPRGPHRPLIGAHIEVVGGLAARGLAEAAEVGAEAIQVFVATLKRLRDGDTRVSVIG